MRVGDKLHFKKFQWTITRKIKHFSGFTEYRYRVHRKHFFKLIPLSITNQDYFISDQRWKFLKNKLKDNPNYHYNMHLWSCCERK